MTALAFKPVTVQSRHAKVLFVGEAGTGKTHAMLTFPDVAVIDAEGSIDWFADRFQFQAVPTKSYADARQLVKDVREGRVKCKTLGIDALTSIYNTLVNVATIERQKQGFEDLRPIDWNRIKRKFSSLLDELYHQLDVNVVCVGWIKAEYAKPGTRVNGAVVKANDLVQIGETFDGDKKTMHAFDFVFKVLGNDGKRTRVEVMKSRSGMLRAGQVIEDFSYAKTIEPLLPKGDATYRGMVDEQATVRDVGVLDKEPKQPASSQDTPEKRAKRRASIAISCNDHGVSDAERHAITRQFFFGQESMAEDADPRLSFDDLGRLKELLSRFVHDRQVGGKGAFTSEQFEQWLEVTK